MVITKNFVGREKKGQVVFHRLFFSAAERGLKKSIWKDDQKLMDDNCQLGKNQGRRFSTSAGA